MTDYNAEIAWNEALMPWNGIDEYGSQEAPFFFGAPHQMVAPKPSKTSRAFQNFEYRDGRLHMKFLSGKTYSYRVTEEIYRQFLQSESKGAFFHEHIRPLPFDS